MDSTTWIFNNRNGNELRGEHNWQPSSVKYYELADKVN